MKNLKIYLLMAFLVSSVAVNAHHSRHHGDYRHRPHVNTPLDGGLLSILGVGGIAYYLARKKRNNKEL